MWLLSYLSFQRLESSFVVNLVALFSTDRYELKIGFRVFKEVELKV